MLKEGFVGRTVRILVDDIEFLGKIIATTGELSRVAIGVYSFEIDYNLAYRAVYMQEIIRI